MSEFINCQDCGSINSAKAVRCRTCGWKMPPPPQSISHSADVLTETGKECSSRDHAHTADIALDWRPISEAPRDGSHILACQAGTSFGWISGAALPPVQTVVHWWGNPGEEGFYASVNEIEPQHPFSATHWKPLDGPPAECPDCPKYVGKCPTCHRPRPWPSSAKPAEGESSRDANNQIQPLSEGEPR